MSRYLTKKQLRNITNLQLFTHTLFTGNILHCSNNYKTSTKGNTLCSQYMFCTYWYQFCLHLASISITIFPFKQVHTFFFVLVYIYIRGTVSLIIFVNRYDKTHARTEVKSRAIQRHVHYFATQHRRVSAYPFPIPIQSKDRSILLHIRTTLINMLFSASN